MSGKRRSDDCASLGTRSSVLAVASTSTSEKSVSEPIVQQGEQAIGQHGLSARRKEQSVRGEKTLEILPAQHVRTYSYALGTRLLHERV